MRALGRVGLIQVLGLSKENRTMKGVVVRLAQSIEQAALEALQMRASLNNPGDRAAISANPDAIELPLNQIEACGVFVAEASGLIAGFAAILPREDGDFDLDGLFVDPALWRHGVGRILIEHCIETVRNRGSKALHVIGNPHADAFYRSCGFETLGTEQTRFGPALLMCRSVRPNNSFKPKPLRGSA
jgi:GNAT superfamily N-acetyltransferase